ncbi:glycosyltransferase family 4 [Bathycoccus prasinos]|uniref:Glycosyltransferase family 4 n=1 Tax=Bathycoccus prasinos TaxID=41875 RepID=K8ES34_9CHLO|nr:glycosyltransferase family 4 [Bathycoccus prasinos]CCO20769.1 glycosyltransferase family 4 [Bathycoccus prasinos]|eukprot:XP_007508050.1 glycosyltransferase family 4 [Bathycoccus prasinos]
MQKQKGCTLLLKAGRSTAYSSVVLISFFIYAFLLKWKTLIEEETLYLSLNHDVFELIRTRALDKELIHGYDKVKVSGGFLYRSQLAIEDIHLSTDAENYAEKIFREKGTGYIDYQMPDSAWRTVDYGYVSFPSLRDCKYQGASGESIFLSSMLAAEGFRPKLISNFIQHYEKLGVRNEKMLFTIQITDNVESKVLSNLISILKSKGVYFDVFLGKWSSEALMYHQAHKLLHCTSREDWIIVADSDEFHEYPGNNVSEFLFKIGAQGYNVVNGIFLDRVASNGNLLELTGNEKLFKKFNLGCRLHNKFHLGTPKKVMAFKGYLRINRGHHRLALCWFWTRRNYLHLTPWSECPPKNEDEIKPFEKRLNVHHFKWMKGQYEATSHKAMVWKGSSVEVSYLRVLEHLKKCGGICVLNPELKCTKNLSPFMRS